MPQNNPICPYCGEKQDDIVMHVFIEHNEYMDYFEKYYGISSRRHKTDKVVALQGGRFCVKCKKPLTKKEATLDHIVPKSKGGVSTLNNLQIMCKDCNNSKGAKEDIDYR